MARETAADSQWSSPLTTLNSSSDAPVGYVALVRGNHNYRSVWLGEIVSLFGDWFDLIASATLIAKLTGSGLAVGGLFVVRMLAPFLISPVAGVLADRYDRKKLLIACDLARAVIVLGFLLVRSPGQIWLLYGVTTLQLTVSGIFFPAREAILPDIVSARELGAANALSAATWSSMLSIGAALGGLATGQWGIYPAFIIDSLSFVVSAAFLWQVRYGTTPPLSGHNASVRAALTQYVDGLRYLRRHADIFWITTLKAALGLSIGGAFEVIQVILAERIFVIGQGGGTSLGLIYAAAGLGTGLGPIIARRFTGDRVRPLRWAILISFGLAAAGVAMIAPLASFGWVLLGALLNALGTGTNWVFSSQLLLQLTPSQVRGRVFASDFAAVTLTNAIGSGAAGWLLDRTPLSLPGMLAAMALFTAVLGALWWAWITMGAPARAAEHEWPGTDSGV
jgi:NRE family putative nickel resistance protein-like MFS transporter